MTYEKKCPNCDRVHNYSNKYTLDAAIKNNSYCNKCAELLKHQQHSLWKSVDIGKLQQLYLSEKLSINDIAKKLSLSYKVIRKALIYNNIQLRKRNTVGLHKHTVETREKIKNKNSGVLNPNYGKKMLPHVFNALQKSRPKHASEITKLKQRLSRLRWLEKTGGRNPHNGKFFNKTACLYLDELSLNNGWNLQHALNGGERVIYGYSVDGYDVDKNIIVEYDEPRHYDKNGNLKPKDIKRMKRIIDHTKCEFYRYNEKNKTLTKYK